MNPNERPLKAAYRTDRGIVRQSNQDRVFADESLGLYIVADGMGGHNAGDVAGSIAVTVLADGVRRGLLSGGEPRSVVIESVFAAHEAVLSNACKDPALEDMGTTVVVALFVEDHFLVCHAGDSRAYLIRNGTIRQITEDHSFVSEWLRDGLISRGEARNHPARHGITMAVGVDDDFDPALTCVCVEETDRLLLCSDGLTDMLEDFRILEIVRSAPTLQDACDNLVKSAIDGGGTDNITVLLARR